MQQIKSCMSHPIVGDVGLYLSQFMAISRCQTWSAGCRKITASHARPSRATALSWTGSLQSPRWGLWDFKSPWKNRLWRGGFKLNQSESVDDDEWCERLQPGWLDVLIWTEDDLFDSPEDLPEAQLQQDVDATFCTEGVGATGTSNVHAWYDSDNTWSVSPNKCTRMIRNHGTQSSVVCLLRVFIPIHQTCYGPRHLVLLTDASLQSVGWDPRWFCIAGDPLDPEFSCRPQRNGCASQSKTM